MIYYFQYEKENMTAYCENAILRMPELLRQEFGRISRPENRLEHLLAWSLLEKAVQTEYGIDSLEQMDICRTEKGKPYSRAYPELYFHLSHCESACAGSVSSGQVGIDVERKFPYRPSLAKKVCHEEEWKYLNSLPEEGEDRAEFLRILWSVKESLVKYEGSGLGYGVERLNVMPLFAVPSGRCKCEEAVFPLRRECVPGTDKISLHQVFEVGDMGRIEVQVMQSEYCTLAASSRARGLKIVRIEELSSF